MGLFDKLFGKKQPEAPAEPEQAAPEQPEIRQKEDYLDEIQKITDRLEEIQAEMTEENKAQYQAEIKALLQREVKVLEKQFPGKDKDHG